MKGLVQICVPFTKAEHVWLADILHERQRSNPKLTEEKLLRQWIGDICKFADTIHTAMDRGDGSMEPTLPNPKTGVLEQVTITQDDLDGVTLAFSDEHLIADTTVGIGPSTYEDLCMVAAYEEVARSKLGTEGFSGYIDHYVHTSMMDKIYSERRTMAQAKRDEENRIIDSEEDQAEAPETSAPSDVPPASQ